jgi:hypothetical protein
VSETHSVTYVSLQLGSEIYSHNITCGRNATSYTSTTNTATILAGAEVGFHTNTDADGARGIVHGGLIQIYLVKVPEGTKIREFSGYELNIQWFKIESLRRRTIQLGLP